MNSVDIFVDGQTSNSNSRCSLSHSGSSDLKPFSDIFDKYNNIKMGYYVKTLTAMETRIMQVFESCFDTMRQIEFLKHRDNCVEDIKTEYKDSLRNVLLGLSHKKENVQYITMRELQIYLEKLEKTIAKRICEFVQKQIEVLRLNQIINDEIESPQEAANTSSQSNGTSNPQTNQLQEMESNFGSTNSNELKKDNNNTTNSEPSNLNKLPKFATKILHQWLCDHLEDPYPTIEEKMLLSAKTKLSLRQITNWFVNHRGRKLKTLRNNRKFTNQIRSKLLLASGK